MRAKIYTVTGQPELTKTQKRIDGPIQLKYRGSELLEILRDYEQAANKRGDGYVFATLTIPLKQLVNRSANHIWAKIRRKLTRQRVTYQGIIISEQHPENNKLIHQHYLLFCSRKQLQIVKSAFNTCTELTSVSCEDVVQ